MLHLTLAWWNTGLSPTKSQDRANSKEFEAAAVVLRWLLDVVKVDFIALCEVSAKDVAVLQGLLGHSLNDFSVLTTQDKAGRSHFDTSLIYRNQIQITAKQTIIRWKLEHAKRVAQRFQLELADGFSMQVYLSHWPSRAGVGAGDPDRMILGTTLRESVDLVFEDSPRAPLILMGDFNDEPFDPVMDNALFSSRDKSLVLRTPKLLYNPFWRHMSSFEYVDEDHRHSNRGTYFHSSGQFTRWRTFDHMMFSASLVTGESGWMLDEHATRVVEVPEFVKLVEEKSTVFDHLPIVGRLLRS